MNEIEARRIHDLRKWARLCREYAAKPECYVETYLHTIKNEQERYCAAGLAIPAMYPDDTPHDEMWEEYTVEDDGTEIYQEKDDMTGTEATLGAETVQSMGLWPEFNPFADRVDRNLETGSHPDPELAQYSHPDQVWFPISEIQESDAIYHRGKGMAELDGVTYVSLYSLSDTGQQYWPDIARFLERHADLLEAEANSVEAT